MARIDDGKSGPKITVADINDTGLTLLGPDGKPIYQKPTGMNRDLDVSVLNPVQVIIRPGTNDKNLVAFGSDLRKNASS